MSQKDTVEDDKRSTVKTRNNDRAASLASQMVVGAKIIVHTYIATVISCNVKKLSVHVQWDDGNRKKRTETLKINPTLMGLIENVADSRSIRSSRN